MKLKNPSVYFPLFSCRSYLDTLNDNTVINPLASSLSSDTLWVYKRDAIKDMLQKTNQGKAQEDYFSYILEEILSCIENPGCPDNEFNVVIIDFEADGLLLPFSEKSTTSKILPPISKIHCMAYWSSADPSGKPGLIVSPMPTLHSQPSPIKMDGKPVILIAHNGLQFDRFLISNDEVLMLDTKILAQLLRRDPGMSMSLKNLAQELTPTTLKGDFNGPWDHYTPDMGTYCMQDVTVLREVLIQLLSAKSNLFYNPCSMGRFSIAPAYILESTVAQTLTDMGTNGVAFDCTAASSMLSDRLLKMASIETSLQSVFPPITTQRISSKTGKVLKPHVDVFNPGSRQAIASRFKAKYAWEPKEFTPSGQPVVDEQVLSTLTFPEAKQLVEYFNYQKDSAFLTDWLTRAQAGGGYIYHQCNNSGTLTWRCSHSNPNLGQVNHGSDFRKLFSGHTASFPYSTYRGLYGADLKNLEFRILGHYLHPYDKGRFTDIVLNKDIHSENAEAFQFVKKASEATKGSWARETSKVGGFAILYGAGPPRFMEIANCTYNQAQTYINNFKKNTIGLERLIQDLTGVAVSTGAIRGLDHRPLLIRSAHAALNTLLQAGGAIVAKLWLMELCHQCPWNIRPALFVHDEVQFKEMPGLSNIPGFDWNNCVNNACKGVTSILDLSCPIAADAATGDNWASTH